MRRLPAQLLARLAVAGLGAATPLAAVPAIAAPATDSVTAPLQALSEGISRSEKTSVYSQRAAIVGPLLARAFDLPAILKASVGLRYNAIPEAQKQELLSVFKDYSTATHLSHFGPNSNVTIAVHDATPYAAIPGAQLVHTQIVVPNDSPTEVDYVVHQGPQGWQVTDVLLTGTISQVAVQRSDFTALLNQGGVTGLIDGLKKKVATLSGS